MDEQPFHYTADDLVGILIHNANQMAAILSTRGTNTNWEAALNHLARMYEVAQRAQSMTSASASDDPTVTQTN